MKRIAVLSLAGVFGTLCASGGTWQSVGGAWDGVFSDSLHWNGGFASDGANNTLDSQNAPNGLTVTVNEATDVTGRIYFGGWNDRPAVLDACGSSFCFATQTVASATWPQYGAFYGRFDNKTFLKHNSDDARWNKMAQAKITDAAVKIWSPEPGIAEMRVTGGTTGGVFDFVHPDPRGDTKAANGARPTMTLFEADYYQPAKSAYNHCRLAFENTTAYLPSVNIVNYPTTAEIALSNSTLRAFGNINLYASTNIITLAGGSSFGMDGGGWGTMGASSGTTIFRMDESSSISPMIFSLANSLRLIAEGGSIYPTSANAYVLSNNAVLDLRRTVVSRSQEAKVELSGNARLLATDCTLTNGTKFTTKTTGDAKVELSGGTLVTPLMAGADGARIDLTNVTVGVRNWGLSKGRVAMTDCTLSSDSVFNFSGTDGIYGLTNVTGETSKDYNAGISGSNVITFAAAATEKTLIVNSNDHGALGSGTYAELNVTGGTLEFRCKTASSRLNLAHGGMASVAVLNVSGGRLVSKVTKDGVTRDFGLGITHGTGFINVSGGEVDVSGCCICTEDSGNTDESVFRQTGGRVKVASGTYQANCQSYGLCATGNDKKARKARIALDGGITEANIIAGGTSGICRGGTGRTAFEADGGTVKVNGANAFILRDFDEATLGEKGLTVDANGYGATISQNLTSQPDETGRLFLTGTGTTTVSGTNTVEIVVNGGTATFAATADNTGVDLVVTNGGTIAFASGGAKNRTFSSLVLGDAASTAFLNLKAGEPLTVTGDVSVGRLSIVLSGAFTTGQSYSLLTCGGTISEASKEAWRKALANGLAADQGCDLAFEDDGQGGTVLKMAVRTKQTLTLSVDANTTSNVTEDLVFAMADELVADVGALGTLNMTGSASQGSLRKTGAGRAIFDNAANLLAGGVTVEAGLLSFPYAANFADACLKTATLTVGTGTLALGRIGADPVALATLLRIKTAAAADAAVVKADSDMTLAAPTVTQGCFVKRGAGTLTLEASGTCAFSSDAGTDVKNNMPHTDALAFDEFGTPPTDNYSALTVAEGDLVLKGKTGASYTTSGSGAVYVGMPVQGIAKPARLVVDGVAADFNGNHFHVGSSVRTSNCPQPNSEFIVTNGAAVRVTSLRLSWGTDNAAHPSVRVSGNSSTLRVTEYIYLADGKVTAASEAQPQVLVTDGASLLMPAMNDGNVNHALVLQNDAVAVFDGSLLAAGADRKRARLRVTGTGGTLVFRNGAECRVSEVKVESDTATADLTFDDAAWSFGDVDTLTLTRPARVTVTARNKGLVFAPQAGTNLTFGLTVSGSGDLVKRGAGSLTLAAAPTLTGVCRIEEGSFALADGVTATGLRLVGSGSLTGGTFAQATLLAPLGDAGAVTGAVPVVAGATFSGRTNVDLARTTPIALPCQRNVLVTTYTGTTPNVSKWKVVNTATECLGARFVAANGEIRMTLRPAGFMLYFR